MKILCLTDIRAVNGFQRLMEKDYPDWDIDYTTGKMSYHNRPIYREKNYDFIIAYTCGKKWNSEEYQIMKDIAKEIAAVHQKRVTVGVSYKASEEDSVCKDVTERITVASITEDEEVEDTINCRYTDLMPLTQSEFTEAVVNIHTDLENQKTKKCC